ncbi:MAG: EAL domain-containing protein [Pseudomonadota bacterium]
MSIRVKILSLMLAFVLASTVLVYIAGQAGASNLPALPSEVMNPIIIVLLVVGTATGFLVTRWLTPIHKLSDFTKMVTKTRDYNARCSVESDPSISELASNINSLLDTINDEIRKNSEKSEQLLDAQENMNRLARYDNVTKLPNRHYFMETISRALYKAKRQKTHIAVMFFDVDGFKLINDTYGYAFGDKLLAELALRTKDAVRKEDLVASMGGDEFIVLLSDNPEVVLLQEIAQRLASNLIKPFFIENLELKIDVNIGIATSDSADYDITELISNADVALYVSKVSGPRNYTIYAPHMKLDKKRRLEIANAIDDSLSKDEFYLVYQAKVDEQFEVIGYEALMRWTHPQLGNINPGEFIPIAEQSGKIYRLTRWLIKQVMIDMEEITAGHTNNIKVSLNLSAHDLNNGNLAGYIAEMLSTHNVKGESIELEVTETTYLENFDIANTFFKKMRSLGCTLALDDFGTGYSSLSYLTQIDIDTLKVDKQFIDNLCGGPKSIVITQTIITMAKQLNLQVCAEGVETREQVDALFEIGCDAIQGFYFSYPEKLKDINTVKRTRAYCSDPA